MKTHIELGISEAELAGLIKVRDYLRGSAAGTFLPIDDIQNPVARHDPSRLIFNMSTTCRTYECGTAACIGGSLSLVVGGRELTPNISVNPYEAKKSDEYVSDYQIDEDWEYREAPGLGKLFYPIPIAKWSDIKPDVAADAIDRFLETGDPDWVGIAKKRGIRISARFI